jgi:hypothetical protein
MLRSLPLLALLAAPASAFDAEAVMAQARVLQAGFPIGGGQVDPDHDPAFRARPGAARIPVDACRTSDGVELNRRGVTVEGLLRLLERSPAASAHVRRFRAEHAAGRLAVGQLTDAVRREIGGPGDVMATFQYRPRERVQNIFVDLDAELGVLAVQFYHELTHGLDPQVVSFYTEFDRRFDEIDAAKRAVYQGAADRLGRRIDDVDYGDLTLAERRAWRAAKAFENDNLWAIEHRAFTAQHRLIAELAALIPCYDRYLVQQEASNGLRTRYPDVGRHLHFAYGLYPPGAPVE